MNAIYLIGFMGSGKTTIGTELAKKLDLPFFDTDEEIIKSENRPISQIFAEDGEEYFRQAETKALHSLPTENVIVSTGGGIILNEENRSYMKKNGNTFFLYCSPDKLFERLKDDTARPLLSGDKRKEIESRLEVRLPLYKEANHIIDTSDLSIEETVKKITDLLTKNEKF
ncbi:shikimate kinase [Pueribacillus theae]|uniref:Shikimate kinase n=1 Tax=Pueribacillus theae TaxID=2171751 RepID=A0A2U1K7U0_9BACI|nr:shikimate kinase [Pueribacillus theae]PWA13335.1 shikimate kinase [Pueribacillus theae]